MIILYIRLNMRGRPARQREIYRRLQDDERERGSENEARRMLLIFLITSQPRAPSSWLCAIKLDESLASQVPNYVLVYTGGTRNEQLGGGVRTSSPAGSNAAMRSPAGLFSRFLYYRKRRPNQSASSKHPCTRRFRRILP